MIALIPNCAFLSETSRMLIIGQALRQRGMPVAFASHGGPFTHVLEQAGESVTRLEPVQSDDQARQWVEGVVNLGRPGLRLQTAQEVRASVQSEVAFLRNTGAKLVATGFALTTYLSGRVAGVPLCTSHGGAFVPPVFERGLAPVPTQAPAPFLDWLPGPVLRWMANRGPLRMQGPVRFLNEIAAELGVEPVPSLAALMVGDLTLVTETPTLLGIPDAELAAWRPSAGSLLRPDTRLRYTGPLFAKLDLPVPARVEAFLSAGRATAYVALTSTTPEFVRTVVKGLRDAGLRVLVASTIHPLDDLAGSEVCVAGILPSHLIMPRVQVAAIMGGQGSVQTAMASGVPFVGFPLHPEQELNVALAVRRGLAIGLGPRRATPKLVAGAARRILSNPDFSASAKATQALYANVDGPGNAAEAILTHLRDGAPFRA